MTTTILWIFSLIAQTAFTLAVDAGFGLCTLDIGAGVFGAFSVNAKLTSRTENTSTGRDALSTTTEAPIFATYTRTGVPNAFVFYAQLIGSTIRVGVATSHYAFALHTNRRSHTITIQSTLWRLNALSILADSFESGTGYAFAEVVFTTIGPRITDSTITTDVGAIATDQFTASSTTHLTQWTFFACTGVVDTGTVHTFFPVRALNVGTALKTGVRARSADAIACTTIRFVAGRLYTGAFDTKFAFFAGIAIEITTGGVTTTVHTDVASGTLHINTTGKAVDTLAAKTALCFGRAGHGRTGIVYTATAIRTDTTVATGTRCTGIADTTGVFGVAGIANFVGTAGSIATGIGDTGTITTEFARRTGDASARLNAFAIGGAADTARTTFFVSAEVGFATTEQTILSLFAGLADSAVGRIAQKQAIFRNADLTARTIDV